MSGDVRDDRYPLDVTLYDVKLQEDNTFLMFLDFPDGTRMGLEFADGSSMVDELLELLTRHATKTFAELGARGVVVSGLTPVESEDR